MHQTGTDVTPEKFTIRLFTTQTTSDARDVTRSRVTPRTHTKTRRTRASNSTEERKHRHQEGGGEAGIDEVRFGADARRPYKQQRQRQ